ncbi:MAG TPA: glycosyltransferase family 1 protein [Candidatus Saccharimonadales bacterium]
MTLELIKALEKHPDNKRKFKIVLVVAFDKKKQLDRWGFDKVSYKTIPIPMRPFNMIWKFDLLPPMDLWLGKGVYVFPNYKNWRLLFSRSLTYICDIGYILYPQFVSPKNLRFMQKNMPKWIKRADKVLAISKNAQAEIIEALDVKSTKMLLVSCGVDEQVFYKRPKAEIERLKKTYGITKDYILYLGNIEPRKNTVRLVEAYKLLPAGLRGRYSLVIVGGGGWLNEPINEAIKQARSEGYDIVRPDKYIPEEELPALQSGATILVHPALYEGFGISLLQAMSCGTPVIAADNSSLPEVVGNAALLVDAENEQDISDKMKTLLEDKQLRGQLADKGTERARQYSWDKSAAILLNEIMVRQ